MNRIVCWFSCGAASAVATKMTIAKYKDNPDYEVIVAYCKVLEESPDNERFLKECEQWFEHPVTILINEHYGGSIIKVFKTNFFRTPAGSPCTRALKKQVREKFQRPDDIHVFGYTAEEEKRLDSFIDANNVEVYAPLIEDSITKENCLAMIERAGIELPILYKQGFPHNNCIMCVKGGMGYQNRMRKFYPEQFKIMAELERERGYTILKDKDGPIYLDELDPERGRIEDEPNIECGIFCEMAEREYND